MPDIYEKDTALPMHVWKPGADPDRFDRFVQTGQVLQKKKKIYHAFLIFNFIENCPLYHLKKFMLFNGVCERNLIIYLNGIANQHKAIEIN